MLLLEDAETTHGPVYVKIMSSNLKKAIILYIKSTVDVREFQSRDHCETPEVYGTVFE